MNTLAIIISSGLLVGCGVVGSPIPPEFVGVAPTIAKQKQQHAREAAKEAAESPEQDPTLHGHDIDLPPSHPVGTR